MLHVFALYLAAVSPSSPVLWPLPCFVVFAFPAAKFGGQQHTQSTSKGYFINIQKRYHIEVAALGHWF